MLDFEKFGPDPVPVLPDTELGAGVRLVFDDDAAMALTVRCGTHDQGGGSSAPTLVLRGENRAPDDWLGLEIDIPHWAHDVEITARNYPVQRLFLRLHFDHSGRYRHLDLPDVASSDMLSTRVLQARLWQRDDVMAADSALRLTVLIPSTPWFAMELQSIVLRELADA